MSNLLKGYAGQDARPGEPVEFRNRDTGVSLLTAHAMQRIHRGDLLVMKSGKAHLDRSGDDLKSDGEVRP